MTITGIVLGVFLSMVAVEPAAAGPGFLLLADSGTPGWNAEVTRLATTVDAQKPAEAAFAPFTPESVQAAVDRLLRRGVTEIVLVPLFLSAPVTGLTSQVKASVPLRTSAGYDGDSVAAEIVAARAHDAGKNPAVEMLLLFSHRAGSGADKKWVPDLPGLARQLNQPRQFAGVMSATAPVNPPATATPDVLILRRVLEQQSGMGRRIVVIPVDTPYGSVAPAIKEQLQGIPHEVARHAPFHDRLVAWIVSRADAK